MALLLVGCVDQGHDVFIISLALYLANKELTLRKRQSLRTLRNLSPRLWSCLLNRRLMEWKGNVEQTSKANQVDRYLKTDNPRKNKFRSHARHCSSTNGRKVEVVAST
jgi:hypothetical protein